LYQFKLKHYPPYTSSLKVLNEDSVSIFHSPRVFLHVKPNLPDLITSVTTSMGICLGILETCDSFHRVSRHLVQH